MKKTKESPATTLGKSVFSLRKANEMTQISLANILGTDAATVSRIERGQQWVSEDMAIKIADAFGVEFYELVSSNKVCSESANRVAQLFDILDLEKQTDLLRYLKYLMLNGGGSSPIDEMIEAINETINKKES